MNLRGYRIRAVLLDFDGTLTRPGALDFAAIKAALGCPAHSPVLEYIQGLPDQQLQHDLLTHLDGYETEAAAESQPNQGAQELVHWIKQRGLAVGIITRNSRATVLRALENFPDLRPQDFNLIITRDDPSTPKPSPQGIHWAARHLKIPSETILMVGDYLYDTQAGMAAGVPTVLLDPMDSPHLREAVCDFRIRRLDDLKPIVTAGLPLPAGKLPNDLLQRYLHEFNFEDPSILIPPQVGEDVVAVDIQDSQVLILKSDPITFATDAIGRYAVLVNANDIATAGARPRWFLTTLLMPCGFTPSQVRQVMGELVELCQQWEISLCGGHTEITDAVRRPVVIGMMAGTVKRQDLVDKKAMQAGDCVLLTKNVAVEGTAIIAREFGARLMSQGFSDREIASARNLLDQISIVEEARLAARDHLASAMHDVTEGGIATALEELSQAGGHRILVDADKIPVFGLTRRICAALGLDPLGLIGSGSLLICCRPEHRHRLMQRIRRQGIHITWIGKVTAQGSGIDALVNGRPTSWPRFAADEITKLF